MQSFQAMSDPDGYYASLNLQPGSSIADCELAYRTLQKKYHPDFGSEVRKAKLIKNEEDREKRLKEISALCCKINEAKQTLHDEKKKEMYDRGVGKNGPQFEGGSIFDLISGMTGRSRVRKEKDTVFKTKISMKESFEGKLSKFRVKRRVVCKCCKGMGGSEVRQCGECNGRGCVTKQLRRGFYMTVQEEICETCKGEKNIISGKPCEECNGSKYIKEEKTVEVNICKGTVDGTVIPFQGLGDETIGKVTGDLLFQILVSEDKDFRRVGNDLVGSAKIDLYTALLGGKIVVRHIDGRLLEVAIKKVKNFRDSLRIAGEGFSVDGAKGDFYIETDFVVPEVDKKKLATVLPVPVINCEKVDGACAADYADLPAEVEEEEEQTAGSVFSQFFSF